MLNSLTRKKTVHGQELNRPTKYLPANLIIANQSDQLMKVIILFFLFCLIWKADAQNDNKHSIGVDAAYLTANDYYDLKKNNGYGVSVSLSEKIFPKIKVSLGLNYSFLNSYACHDEHFGKRYLKDKETNTETLAIPFIITWVNNSDKRYKVDPFVGVVASKVISYEFFDYWADQPRKVSWTHVPDKPGWYFRTGVNASHAIGRHMVLNASPYADFRFVKYAAIGAWADPYPPMNTITLGFKLGLDYQW